MLVVDDDADLLEMLTWCMRAAGWLVEAVSDGREALVAAALVEPDVIFMDLHLPGVLGLDAIRRLKSDEDTKHIPIIACTGVLGPSAEQDARAAGADGFVTKPCEPEAIRALVEAVVARRRREAVC